MFSISGEGVALIKRFEGLMLEAYYDDVGVLTIGYGHTGSDVYEGQVISEAEAEEILRRDISRFEDGVTKAVKVPITQSMFDALVSFSFNVGVGALNKSTALKRLNKEDYEGAAEALTWWNKGRIGGELVVLTGLTRRRTAEAALFLRDLDQLGTGADEGRPAAGEIVENKPRRNNPITTRTTGGAATSGAAGAAGAGAVLLDDEDGSDSDNSNDTDNGDTTTTPDPECVEPGEVDAASEGDETPSEEPALPVCETDDDETPTTDPVEEPTADEDTVTETETSTEQPAEEISEQDYTDAFVVAAGVLAVLAAIYVIAARIDDWMKYRR